MPAGARQDWEPKCRPEAPGHESIQTMGDIYTDGDIDQLAEKLIEVVDDD
jgi:hypothetical protein